MKIIGHRGARGLAPENTVASMLKAIEYHVDEIEFDLRVTKDNVVVLHHNASLKDRSGKRLFIAGHSFKELKSHKPNLTTFEEAMKAINRRVPALIEIKTGVKIEPIVKSIKSLKKLGWQSADFLLGSKGQRTLRQLHRALPDIQMVVIEPISVARAVWRARQVATKRLSLNQMWLWRGFIWKMDRRGWELYPYTLNDPRKAQRLLKYGIAGVITDNPERFTVKK
jgi:glycerophosphoryl diester phosphodiesterase